MQCGNVLGNRRIAEPQLHRAEAAREQLLGFGGQLAEIVHQPEAATVVSGDRSRLRTQQPRQRQLGRNGKRIPARRVEASDRHAHEALHADQREALHQRGRKRGWIGAFAFGQFLDRVDQIDERQCHRRQIAEHIGAAGDAFLGFEIDQQKRHLAECATGGAENEIGRDRDRHGIEGADGQDRH